MRNPRRRVFESEESSPDDEEDSDNNNSSLSSSSSITSSSSSEEEESSSGKRKRKKPVTTPTRRNNRKRPKHHSDSESEEVGGHKVKSSRTGSRSDKQELIAAVLSRWWYILPPWPPTGYNYEVQLKEKGYRKVTPAEWETADDISPEGLTKVYEISAFPGIFRDPQGNALDLRPKEGRPCYTTFKEFTISELKRMLRDAIQNQLAALPNAPYWATERQTLQQLETSLKKQLQELIKEVGTTPAPRLPTTNSSQIITTEPIKQEGIKEEVLSPINSKHVPNATALHGLSDSMDNSSIPIDSSKNP